MQDNDEKIKEEPFYEIENFEETQTFSEEQKYKCRICEFECDSKEITTLHVQMDHLKDKQCGVEFSGEDYTNFLNLHIELVHEDKNPKILQDISTSLENDISINQFDDFETVYVEDHKKIKVKLETEENNLKVVHERKLLERIKQNVMLDNKPKTLSTESRNDIGLDNQSSFERPKMSYCQLISEALINSTNGMLVLSDIYEAISSKYPYFKTTTKSWQNSIRHNLSLDKSFTKEEKIEKIIGPDIENEKRGCYWKLADPKYLLKKSKKRKKIEESQIQLEGSSVDHEGKKPKYETNYKCKICDANFKDKPCLKRHVQSVHEENNICDICSLGFQSKFTLSEHILTIHEGMTPFKCDFCNASFPSEKRIKRHVEQVHEKRKPFKCNLCKTGYFEKSKLKIHMKSPLHLAAIDKAVEKIDINETNSDTVFVTVPDIIEKINEDTLEVNSSNVSIENHENIDIKLELADSMFVPDPESAIEIKEESLERDESFDFKKNYQNDERKNEIFDIGLEENEDLSGNNSDEQLNNISKNKITIVHEGQSLESNGQKMMSSNKPIHERKSYDVIQGNFNTQEQIVQEKKSLDNEINAVQGEIQGDYEKVEKNQISSEDQNYKCRICEFESDNKIATTAHVQMVHKEKKHNMIQCNLNAQGQIVVEEKCLDDKINLVHDEKQSGLNAQISSGNQKYKRRICEFESNNKIATSAHIQTVHEEEKHNMIQGDFNAQGQIVKEKKSLDNKINMFHDEKQSGSNAQISFEKPQMTYDQLISEALRNSSNGMLVVSNIYKAICSKHPYYKKAGRSWQIKVKHALVSYKKFEKACETTNGFYWKLV